MPSELPHFSEGELLELSQLSFPKLSSRIARYFMDERFSDQEIDALCEDAYNFDIGIQTFSGSSVCTNERNYILELFHGPTLAFKDFAARFLARAASKLVSESNERRTILVATSGDTGGAIGSAFAGQPGFDVFILYPKKGVSRIQEAQLTTIGAKEGNVHALCVEGSFDECQDVVKAAFADEQLAREFQLMSANSINIGRIIPQSFYFLWAGLRLMAVFQGNEIVVSVPSGNLGNVTGALMARLMGAPIGRLIVGHNVNDPFVEYLKEGVYQPRDSVRTLSNAMDIGRPNNMARILAFLDDDVVSVRDVFWGASFTDDETEEHLRTIYKETGYVMCPHTTIGHLAAQKYKDCFGETGVFITAATAHPAKFADDVTRIIGEPLAMPSALSATLKTSPRRVLIEPTLSSLQGMLEASQA